MNDARLPVVDLQHLRAFRSVVATGSVRAAADILGYSPSAISQQVTALQREVGVTLLGRVGRGVEPTVAGHALAARIDGLLGELGDLDDFARALREGRNATLTLAYFASLGATWLPGIVGPLAADFPDTRIELILAEIHDPTRRPRADLQLLVMPPESTTPEGYVRHPLARDAYVVALPAGDDWAGRESIGLAELAARTWIDNDFAQGACRQIVLDASAAAGFRPRFRIQTHDYPTALGLVATGVGITVLPSLATRHVPPGVAVVPVVDPTPVRSIHALVLRDSQRSPAVVRALELATAVAAPGVPEIPA